ncbi:NADH-quinone oxidoreductase subunit A [Thermosulfidibacter takaii ABI70S6]|uniref:NADH-quinone oxidoreductase subunit A n=1 Tax=Thermosulfidibacter takaii (strain DSM 17441 / JCM 13301 / NBRC 103674 / ABI70S6) TaxID=1298851 RepID=A0A0S3QRP3_THET7|nr:NADH-quinone oxidoreductase subunit A [Thermosulfidibacter takaii]BAT71008.1 NADH-quinone oxidoreductase subunit A [Thermosulfidibacter takaii ABI70S6]
MNDAYWPLILVALLAFGFGSVTVVLSKLLGPKKPDESKLSPYECGVEPVGDARKRFFIHYYVIALLFLIFDIEVVFTYPWAVKFKAMGLWGFVEMVIFIAIFLLIYVYVLGRGALEWE